MKTALSAVRRLKPVSFSLAGIAFLIVMEWARRGAILPISWQIPLIPEPASYVLPVPLAFLLWRGRDEEALPEGFSLAACLLSLIGFMAAAAPGYFSLRTAGTLLGAIAGMCVFANPRDLLQRVKTNLRRTMVALVAASSSAGYSLLLVPLWPYLSSGAAELAALAIRTARISDVWVRQQQRSSGEYFILMQSHYFTADINKKCCGLEGIFLFLFLLSVFVLIDWKWFRKRALFELYAIGIVYMFLANTLRIVLLFLLGNWAWNPASGIARKWTRDVFFDLFHSYIGWALYLLAFWIFITAAYQSLKHYSKSG